MIEFNRPCIVGTEQEYIAQAIQSGKLSGGQHFARLCEQWFVERLDAKACLLTPSCTAALEMAAMLLDITPGDEVIMPSFTFVSTANAFVLRGAKVVFVDIRPDTLNINEQLIEAAISDKTKAIVVVHYAGVGCEMASIAALAEKYQIALVEDAAQCVDSYYDARPLGSFGQLATFSFHETKNITSGGEGGALVVNDPSLVERAEILREKGTNRKAFFRGEVDKYTWVDIGSSYLPSELQAAYLWAQLESIEQVTQRRLQIWQRYYDGLKPLADAKLITLPAIPDIAQHNAHIFYVLLNRRDRGELISRLKANGVQCTFHYVPLHLSEFGQRHGHFDGIDQWTTRLSEQIVRLPVWYGLDDAMLTKIVSAFRKNI